MSTFLVTEAAAARIKSLLEQDKLAIGLRVAVEGGGCSGFQYEISLANSTDENDSLFEAHGVKVYVDSESLPLLEGSSLEFIDELGGSFFRVNNPNATSRCGCGQSFSA